MMSGTIKPFNFEVLDGLNQHLIELDDIGSEDNLIIQRFESCQKKLKSMQKPTDYNSNYSTIKMIQERDKDLQIEEEPQKAPKPIQNLNKKNSQNKNNASKPVNKNNPPSPLIVNSINDNIQQESIREKLNRVRRFCK